MSAEPPPPPRVSPDGKFYWDGQRWVPMQQPETQQPRPVQYFSEQLPLGAAVPAGYELKKKGHTGRNLAIGCLGLIALVVVIGIIANAGSKNQPTLKWTVDGRATTSSTVGGTDAVQVTVTNNGSAASNFIIYLNAKDDWFKHHVITDPGGCTINKNLERLECGPLGAGETKTVNIVGSPKDAGNFDFASDAADQEGSTLLYPNLGEITWSETVTA